MRNRILIVDDMPETLVMLMAYLSAEGFEVVTAANGAEALEVLGTETPDLILSDIMMPKMGGFEFIETIRKSYPNNYIPLIFMSAKNKNVAEQMALDLGAEAFLEKPVSLQVVKAAIDAALKKAFQRNRTTEYSLDEVNALVQAKNDSWFSNVAITPESSEMEDTSFICETYFEGGGISGLTVASNLNPGGLFLDTFSNLPAGTILHLRMKLRPGCEIETLGEVSYGQPGQGVGVRFIALDTDTRRLIQDTVESSQRSRSTHATAAH